MRTTLTRADRQARTRDELVDAADRLFTETGFHATSVDAVADAAGYTKGAVYSNFESKEDLFFAVYERRVDRRVEEIEATLASGETAYAGMEKLIAGLEQRHDEGWLAVFFEFWAHVLRHPELRHRFAEQHRRIVEPVATGLAQIAAERGPVPGLDSRELATTMMGVSTALGLERLTRPDVVGPELAVKVNELFSDALGRAPGGAAARGEGDGSPL